MILSILISLLVAYSGLGLILYLMQPSFLYNPVRDVPYSPEEIGLDYEDVYFKASDGTKLHGWYIPAANAEFTVLFCHGNGGNIMHRLDSLNIFNSLGLGCFIFDYRGYGNSCGKPDEQGTYLDTMAAYRYLTHKKKIKRDKIVIFGRSLGGSVAAHLASRIKPGALVLESSFTSYVDMGKKFYPYMPVKYFARFSYRTIDYIKKVRCPVMVVHSRNDEVVPFAFGLELYEAACEPRQFVEIYGSHNDGFLVSGEKYRKAWTDWINMLSRQANRPALGRRSG